MYDETRDTSETPGTIELGSGGQPDRRPDTRRSRRSRRTAAVGVAAGLLGGGAAGLMLTVPSSTSAATVDTSEPSLEPTGETPPATTEPVVDAPVAPDDAPAAPDDARPAPSVRLRETLQALVDDGTITAAQADAVTAHLVANRPVFGDRPMGGPGDGPFRDRWGDRGPGRRGGGPDLEVVAAALGTDAQTLRRELRSGSSIADVASAAGIDIQVVVDAVVDHASDRLQAGVDDGRLSAEEAADRLARFTDRITEMLERAPIAPEDSTTD